MTLTSSERHLGIKRGEVGLEDVVHLEQGEDAAVFVVGEQFAFLRETHGVEAVGLEHLDGEVGDDRYHHQRHKQVIAAREFGDKKDAREGRVHDTRHQSGHTRQGEVGLRYGEADEVEQACADKARDSTHKQRRGEDTAHTTTAVGSHRGDYFEQKDKREIAYQHP